MAEKKSQQKHVHGPLLAVDVKTENHQEWPQQQLERTEFVGGHDHELPICCDGLLF